MYTCTPPPMYIYAYIYTPIRMHLEGIVQSLEALLGELVARVLDPAVRLHQHCGGGGKGGSVGY